MVVVVVVVFVFVVLFAVILNIVMAIVVVMDFVTVSTIFIANTSVQQFLFTHACA